MTTNRRSYLMFLLISYGAVLLWSGINPKGYFIWFLEVVPALAGIAIMLATYRRFPLSNVFYTLAWVHCIILTVGGHYTYAEVPLFNWIRDWLGTQRNSYDGVGHFAQGFMPAIYAREILLRRTPLQRGGWLFTIIVSICLAISAVYELIEWGVAEATGEAADAFLGSQGDVWDTQKDMALCFIGSIISLLTLSRVHDKSMEGLSTMARTL